MESEFVIYTHRHQRDGNVGIGKLSSQYLVALDNIANEYFGEIEDKSATTHHKYYTELTGKLKTEFEKIQFSDVWQGLRVGAFKENDSFASVFENVTEMNEVYYSNPKPNFSCGPLYGAAANLIPHRDCILFNFPGIRVYRAIICATEGNNDTSTEFITHGVERQLNKGDYMVFDFDRTLHQVKKMGQLPTPRVLLKLHFLALDMKYARFTHVNTIYVKFVYLCYVLYYRIARYTEQLGTDPKTFMGFFFGILWEYPFYPTVRNYAFAVYFGLVFNRTYIEGYKERLELLPQNAKSIIIYSMIDIFTIYLCIVSWYYLNHIRKQYIL